MTTRISSLALSLFLTGCAAPSLINTTPDETPRIATGAYQLSARVDPNGNQIAYVNVVNRGIEFPMMAMEADRYRLDRIGVQLLLPELELNGGPTPTIQLRPPWGGSTRFSPIDFGGLLCPELDQRGVHRDDGACDAGAYEH